MNLNLNNIIAIILTIIMVGMTTTFYFFNGDQTQFTHLVVLWGMTVILIYYADKYFPPGEWFERATNWYYSSEFLFGVVLLVLSQFNTSLEHTSKLIFWIIIIFTGIISFIIPLKPRVK